MRTDSERRLSTHEVSRVFRVSRVTIQKWLKMGAPAPPPPTAARHGRGWDASDVARIRCWLEARAVSKRQERQNRNSHHVRDDDAERASAASEARTLFRRVGRDGATLGSVLREIDVSDREAEVLKKIAGSTFIENALTFRQQVRREFLALTEKEEQKNERKA